MQKPVIIISGPTATGKSAAGVELALLIKQKGREAAVVNFDSLLFYHELNIGTAKPTENERQGVPHYLIDVRSITGPMTAADFCKLAEEVMEDLLAKGVIPILVGGSGFYLRALLKGMYEGGRADDSQASEVQAILAKEGGEGLMRRLQEVDPATASRLHINDHYRLARAYEFFLATGGPISKARQDLEERSPYDFTVTVRPHWRLFHAYLDMPKDEHRARISLRTQGMLSAGVLGEVMGLLSKGYSGQEKPLGAIGYKEALAVIRGELSGEAAYASAVDTATHQLAKAQRTFFKKVTGKHEYHSIRDIQKLKEDVLGFLGI